MCGKRAKHSYTITTDKQTILVDLCAEHARPVLAVLAKGQTRPQPSGRRVERTPHHQVIPWEPGKE